MSLFRLDKNYFDTFKILTKPKRKFISGSGELVGAVKVFPLAASAMKEVPKGAAPDSPPLGDSLEEYRLQVLSPTLPASSSAVSHWQTEARHVFLAPTASISFGELDRYMLLVNSASITGRRNKEVEILRFEPSFKFTSDTLRKRVIQEVLFPFYRPQYGSTCNWAFTNYHTLNFFDTAERIAGAPENHPLAAATNKIPSSSVMIYPAMSSSATGIVRSANNQINGLTPYRPTGSFSFEFYINPRYSSFERGGEFKAGTIFHMSSSFALSLVAGDSKDDNGYIDGYRLLLQLSHSADIPPSQIAMDSLAAPTSGHLVYSSSNNSLKRNHWHYCCVRWGRHDQNSTGSFFIDGEEKGTFLVRDMFLTASGLTNSGSWLQATNLTLPTSADTGGDPGRARKGGIGMKRGAPDALFLGNYYEGPNSDAPSWGGSGTDSYIAQFFNPQAAYTDGIKDFYPTVDRESVDAPTNPTTYYFRHPLQAELHELKIYSRYRNDGEILTASISGIENLYTASLDGLEFYVPPFFMKDTKLRDIFQTPFQAVRGSTDDPFNVPLSFGVGGHYLNLENFTKELVKKEWPRLWNLSGSTIDTSTGWQSCNHFLFTTGSVRKRNLTILPCDNGKFSQNFKLLEQAVTSSSALSLFVDDQGTRRLSLISLNNLLPTGSIGEGLLGAEKAGSISSALAGPTPDDPSIPAGSILTIYNRTRDPSSNEVSFFDASNLFYGNKIDPGSYVLSDPVITGSAGRVQITMKDNHRGNLYRCDATGSHATWSTVGTLMYEEGLAVVKTPVIPRFGRDRFEVSLTGQQNIHHLRMSVPAEEGNLDLSANPTFQSLAPSGLTADSLSDFTYITNVNFLDENLNVILKSNFSQAIVKRVDDRFVVRVKLDF